MKIQQKTKLMTMLLAGLTLLLTASCGKDDPDPQSKGKEIMADLKFDGGAETHFSADFPAFSRPTLAWEEGGEIDILVLSAVMIAGDLNYGISVMGAINGPGTYVLSQENTDEDHGVTINLSIASDTDALPEMFSAYNKDKIGSCVLNITSLTNDHIKGTFSAVLYSNSREVVIENGKIDASLTRTNVD